MRILYTHTHTCTAVKLLHELIKNKSKNKTPNKLFGNERVYGRDKKKMSLSFHEIQFTCQQYNAATVILIQRARLSSTLFLELMENVEKLVNKKLYNKSL